MSWREERKGDWKRKRGRKGRESTGRVWVEGGKERRGEGVGEREQREWVGGLEGKGEGERDSETETDRMILERLRRMWSPHSRLKLAKSQSPPGRPSPSPPVLMTVIIKRKAAARSPVFTSLLHRMRAVQVRRPRGFVIHAHFQRGAWARLRGTQTTVF